MLAACTIAPLVTCPHASLVNTVGSDTARGFYDKDYSALGAFQWVLAIIPEIRWSVSRTRPIRRASLRTSPSGLFLAA
jgi:hypothetical protein